jgi:hypothetical protein
MRATTVHGCLQGLNCSDRDPTPSIPICCLSLRSVTTRCHEPRALLHGLLHPVAASAAGRAASTESRSVRLPASASALEGRQCPNLGSSQCRSASQQQGHPSFRRQRASRACESKLPLSPPLFAQKLSPSPRLATRRWARQL